ncbi:septum formation inhibitor Maf [Synechococcus sp. MU1643]|uniref:Maf family protein n=1 Tax=Synechococcus sp. MU1643 TaxID=2508349 RepID=UPI001CF815DF|nr:Maf family protein [Synechococcus sp. MU1643]MCB4428402.1 septum formation inhibitor Maf [Synechococcus sp. MU1643]
MLASASPARRRLLEQAGVQHQVRVSGVDEDQIQHADPAELVKLLAQAKATAVAQTLDPVGDAEITAVLGCDSVLSFAGQVFGKPSGPAEAMERWQRMAGGCGSLLTGHCLIRHGQPEVLASVVTVVRFAPLSQAEIEAYVASGEPLQCAGGFALEGRGGLCIDGLDGCYSNVIGLSLPWLRQQLSAFS